MAQNENYSQVDLRVGTEEQFNAKVGTLPAGTLFGVTDATVSKADLSTDLKNEINGKINKPSSPTTESAITINSSGAISTKPLTSITGKSEVYVGSTTPTNEDEILWINPDGTSGGGGSSGGSNSYRHDIKGTCNNGVNVVVGLSLASSKSTEHTATEIRTFIGDAQIPVTVTKDGYMRGTAALASVNGTAEYTLYGFVIDPTASSTLTPVFFSQTSINFIDVVTDL